MIQKCPTRGLPSVFAFARCHHTSVEKLQGQNDASRTDDIAECCHCQSWCGNPMNLCVLCVSPCRIGWDGIQACSSACSVAQHRLRKTQVWFRAALRWLISTDFMVSQYFPVLTRKHASKRNKQTKNDCFRYWSPALRWSFWAEVYMPWAKLVRSSCCFRFQISRFPDFQQKSLELPVIHDP